MSESGDYTPGAWAGHDFASARKSYDAYAGRSYSAAVSTGKSSKDLIPDSVSTESTSPLVIVVDETGSMGDWPATIFSKLPYLENEGKEYLGEDFEICFMAIGDAYNNETYPLQVRPFAKGLDLKKTLTELVIEGKGGGQTTETYELAALYANEKVNIPKAIKPVMIFIGDEMCYDTISPDHAEHLMGIKIEKTLTTAAVFEKLKQKFAVYLIRKSYGTSSGNVLSDDDKKITASWAKYLGDDHISNLPEAARVVDVIFGILAKETGRIAYFEEELEGRQLADKDGDKKVDMVYKSLRTIHKIPDAARDLGKKSGKSVIRKSVKKIGDVDDEKMVKPLI
jgi:hypothetical protein